MDENMDKLFFNGEFTSKGNFRGEDVYKFLKDLKLKMELQEVPEVGKVGFLHRHLSVTAKTIVGSTIKDYSSIKADQSIWQRVSNNNPHVD